MTKVKITGRKYQFHRSRETINRQLIQLNEHMKKDLPPKAWASEHSVAEVTMYRMVWELGYRRKYVTKEEWADIVRKRKAS